MKLLYLPVMLTLLAFASPHANGEVIITATETNGNVLFTGAGSFNLSALGFFSNEGGISSSFLGNPPVALVGPVLTFEEIHSFGAPRFDLYLHFLDLIVAPSELGPQTVFIEADEGTGDLFGIHALTHAQGSFPTIVVPEGYTSGTQLSGTGVFFNQTFDSLGITPGSYTWSWGSDETFDSLTLHVAPEPSSIALVLLASTQILNFRRKK